MNMKRMGSGIAASVLSAMMMVPAVAADFGGEVLGNADIIGLARAGMAPELIIAKIQTAPNTFDLSTRAMITMKENGVPDQVMSAMMAAAQNSGRAALDQNRFARELENIAIGGESARTAGLAWMLSNRETATPELHKSLLDSRNEIRAAAVRALASLRDQASLPAMRNLLTDQSPQVRQATAEALATLQDAPSINAAEQAVLRQVNPLDGYVRLVGYAKLTQSAPALSAVLSGNPDSLARAAAAWAIGEIGRPGMVARPALETALTGDADPDVRREAVIALAKFHDSNTAAMLQNACRTDPAVRKAALEAMAEYPETVEFFVGVMNLGPDLIAADELETARISLARLTGQDMGMDGSRWTDWFASNRSRFPSAPGSSVGGAPAAAYSGLAELPGVSAGAVSGSSEVDFDRWNLVADPGEIPMAPNVDTATSRSAVPNFMGAGLPPPPGGGAVSAPPMPGFSPAPGVTAGAGAVQMPSSLSPNDFGGSDAGFGSSGLAGSGSEPSLFRTWSSEPDRPIPPASSAASASPMSGGVDESMFMSGMDADAFPMDPELTRDASSTYREVTSLSDADDLGGFGAPVEQPSYSAPAVVQAPTVESAPPGGISLPLPGMGMGGPAAGASADTSMGASGDDGFADLFAAPPSESAADPFAMPSDSFFTSPGDVAGTDDPFAVPDMMGTDGGSSDTPSFWDSPDLQSGDDFLFGSDSDAIAAPFATEADDFAESPGFVPPAPMGGDAAFPVAPPAAPIADELADGGDVAPAAPTEPEEEEKSYAQYLFVEPEPGQVVVGDSLFEGIPAQSVPSMDTPVMQAPIAAPPMPSATPGISAPTQQIAVQPSADSGDGDDDFEPRYAPAGTPMVDTRYITIPGTEQESNRRRSRNASDGSRTVEEIYRPYAQETFQLPAPPAAPEPEVQDDYVPPKGDVFKDPSVPLPPVRPQGTVTPNRDGNLPLLGEGMF